MIYRCVILSVILCHFVAPQHHQRWCKVVAPAGATDRKPFRIIYMMMQLRYSELLAFGLHN